MVRSYRVISLLNCLGKALERVVCELLDRPCNEHQALHPGQFGSRRGRLAIEAVATMVGLMEHAWERGRIAGALCMGVEAAFPSVNPVCLVRRLRELNVDENLVMWTEDFMAGQQNCEHGHWGRGSAAVGSPDWITTGFFGVPPPLSRCTLGGCTTQSMTVAANAAAFRLWTMSRGCYPASQYTRSSKNSECS